MVNEFHVVSACIPLFHWRVESVMEITYPDCLFAVLGQEFRSFPSLKQSYRSVLYAAEGQHFQICSSSSKECVLSQTLSSAHTRLFLVCADGCLLWWDLPLDFLAVVELVSFESKSFLWYVFLDNLYGNVLSRFQNSSFGPERWRKTYQRHEENELLRKFQIDLI